MKSFTKIAAAFFGIIFLTAAAFAQTNLKSFLPDSYRENVFPAFRSMSAPPTAGESVNLVSPNIVISQVYGGAGCGTPNCSTYKNDYIELYNRGNAPQSLNGWSVQYAAATGTSWQVTNLTNVTLQPGQYYLVAEGAGANGINNLPTPDATGSIGMSATTGKVALVNTTTALSGACPTGAQIVDLVGFGASANCNEGGANAPAPSTTTADLRASNGAQDTDNNANDFTAGTPNPRNTASPFNVPPALSISDASLNEGNAGTTVFSFTVSLSAPAPAGGVTFDIATADNTATTADNDYVASALTGQTIPAGGSSYTFNVTVNGDTTVEPNETFFVNVTNVTGATVNDGQGQGTIGNDDVEPAVVEFSSADYREDESQTAVLTVVRFGNLSGTTSVQYSTQVQNALGAAATGGAACTAGVDYVHASGTLTFAEEENFKEIMIQLCGDLVSEPDEFFTVYLSNPTGGVLGDLTSAQVAVNDTASQFRNTSPIFIGTGGDSYESSIEVTGAPTNLGSVRVTLFDLNHITADDLDILLVSPEGDKIILMADAGGSDGLAEDATITFDDSAGQVLPDNTQIFTGKYEPTSWEAGQTNFPAPAPAGPYSEPGSAVGGAVTLASVFGGSNANGTWSLYIRDDNGALRSVGADGVVNGGWGIQFLAPTAAGVSVSGQVRARQLPIANASVTISGGDLSEPRTVKTNGFGFYSFEDLTAGQIYVVTVAAKRYTFSPPSIVLNVGENVTGADFEAEER